LDRGFICGGAQIPGIALRSHRPLYQPLRLTWLARSACIFRRTSQRFEPETPGRILQLEWHRLLAAPRLRSRGERSSSIPPSDLRPDCCTKLMGSGGPTSLPMGLACKGRGEALRSTPCEAAVARGRISLSWSLSFSQTDLFQPPSLAWDRRRSCPWTSGHSGGHQGRPRAARPGSAPWFPGTATL